jgi:hypothetical protein
MSDANTIDVLNRLLAIEYRSLPIYLTDATPWTHPGDEKAAETLGHIVADQQDMARRIAALITERGARIENSVFPTEFTDMNLLSLDFLLGEIVGRQRRNVATIERIVAALAHDREARELAEEVLGSERAHLEALEELNIQPADAR